MPGVKGLSGGEMRGIRAKMMDTNGRPKDSEVQAAEGPPDPELESLIAPQGYSPELVDEVATMETPGQQWRSAVRFLVIMGLLLVVLFWFCTPANLVIPELPPAPHNIFDRPTPPSDKFAEDLLPQEVGPFRLVNLKTEQAFEEPYIGEFVVQGTYIDEVGNPATVALIEADSYINARRYIENYKAMLQARRDLADWKESIYIEDSFIQWAAPGFADRAYGLAWNNDRYFIAVTSPISTSYESLAAEFPY
jgi:hypothetical protein